MASQKNSRRAPLAGMTVFGFSMQDVTLIGASAVLNSVNPEVDIRKNVVFALEKSKALPVYPA